MKVTNKKLVTLAFLASSALVVGAGQVQADAAATKHKAGVAKESPAKTTAVTSIPWSSLNATQKSVLSIGEAAWPTIPVEKQKSFMEGADKWTKTSPEDQKKLLDELKVYVNTPKK